MRTHLLTALLIGALGAAPAVAFAATQAKTQKPAAARHSASTMPTHATQGVVKSVDDGSLVITRAGKKPLEMTFELNSSTQREGTIAAGSSVSVRYREEGKNYVATAVKVQQTKAHNAPKSPSKR